MTMNAARTPYNDRRRLRRSPGVFSSIHPEQHFPANEAYISNAPQPASPVWLDPPKLRLGYHQLSGQGLRRYASAVTERAAQESRMRQGTNLYRLPAYLDNA